MFDSVAQIIDALLFVGVAGALLWFLWRVILRRLYRVWHIRRIGEDRLMREAAARDSRPEIDPK